MVVQGLGFAPIDFEKHNRLARGKLAVLQTTFHHEVICLRDGGCYEPLCMALKARIGFCRVRYELPVYHFLVYAHRPKPYTPMCSGQLMGRLVLVNIEHSMWCRYGTVAAVNTDLVWP